MMSVTWEILPRTSLPSSIPPLLVKYTSDGAGYTVYLTDLTCMWSESMNVEQVIQRSLDEDTSIEPKGNPDQLRILLAKIGDGLRGSDETNLNLLPGNDGKHLTLNICAHLPSPFRPLQWPLHLTPLNSEALRAELLIPLLANQKALKKQVASLLVYVKEKDNVILKLTDKLESSGIDMTMIFPRVVGATVGRRQLGREMAAKVVPGLAPFNEESWRKETSEAEIPSGDENELILSSFPNELPEFKHVTDKHPLNAWRNTLPRNPKSVSDAPELLIKINKERAGTAFQGYERGKMEGEATDFDNDDEFERQATPPSLKRPVMLQTVEALGRFSRGHSKQQHTLTESSEVPSTEAKRLAAPHPKYKKLGLVGGRGHVDELDEQQADTSVTGGNRGVQRSSKTANDHVVGSDDKDEQAPRHFPPSSSTSVKVKHRIGVIGGKRKNIEGDISDTSTKPATSRAFPYGSTGKLGDTEKLNLSAISANMLDEEVHEHQDRSSYASRTPSLPGSPSGIPSTPRTHMTPSLESSQERADRKRAELREVLEEKAKAPIQKRRRF